MNKTLLLSLCLVACGSSSANEWWNVGAEDGSNVTDPWTTEEGGGEDDPLEPQQMWWGEAELVDGTPQNGIFGYVEIDSSQNLICEIEYPLENPEAATGCSACTMAFTFTVGQEEFREGDGCDGAGASGLAGGVVGYGTDGEFVFKQSGNTWSTTGFAEIDGSEWWWEEPVGKEF